MQQTLFTNVSVLDCTGAAAYAGEVLIEGNRIKEVFRSEGKSGGAPRSGEVRVVDGGGATLMPGLIEAHAHFSWNNQDSLDSIGRMPVEEHVLECMIAARTYLECGYTSAVGAAAAKPRLDVVIRNAINAGKIPGPRLLANGPEITTTGGLGDVNPSHLPAYSFVEIVDGAEEMRKKVRALLKEGVDLIKLNLSGEEITITARAEDTLMSDAEAGAAMEEARRRGVRACAHARSAESIKMCIRHGIDIIYHASFADEEALDLLEKHKDHVFVAPALHWLYTTSYEASAWGLTPEIAKQMGYHHELETAIKGIKEMKRRGVRILPGGDFGFAWMPHGTYARDLENFVKLLGFSTMDTILSATKLGGEIMAMPDQLGQIKPGYLADVILVDGDPLADITIFQDRSRLLAIMKDGAFFKEPSPRSERPAPLTEPNVPSPQKTPVTA
ncbi:metal-dependent hydrolase family protein [Pararobbsia alpina]|uniref:Adenine deaminase n=1 Tax=Pararobbsia alpina TaxID=621374 RepID=A0A6S7BFC8_9BURK|nr:amidohydrolase family protein [Pararobbsia alpina]CAB3798387.1 Adenine deaminase [Pararobbsia alpina]